MLHPSQDKDPRWYKVFWPCYGIFMLLNIGRFLVQGGTLGLGDLLIAPICPAAGFTALWWAFWGRRHPSQAQQVLTDAPRLRLRNQPARVFFPGIFADEEDEAQHWLSALRDGTEAQQLEARYGLARIFEQRGMYAEAIALVSKNIQTGQQASANYRWIARLYRAQGDSQSADTAEATAHLRDPETKKTEHKALIYIGVAIGASALSYWAATHGYGDGRYTTWFGPVIVGLRWLSRNRST
jgi:tetratricopeptide (TPR) repeat protein